MQDSVTLTAFATVPLALMSASLLLTKTGRSTVAALCAAISIVGFIYLLINQSHLPVTYILFLIAYLINAFAFLVFLSNPVQSKAGFVSALNESLHNYLGQNTIATVQGSLSIFLSLFIIAKFIQIS